MADLFQDPQQKKGIGEALALALLGAQQQQGASVEYAGYPSYDAYVAAQSTAPETPIAYWGTVDPAGQPSEPDPGVYGQMTPDERDTLGGANKGLTAAGIAASIAGMLGGFATPATGIIGGGIRGALGYDALGLNAGVRGVTSLTSAMQQANVDRYGWGMPGGYQAASDPTARGFGGYNYGDLSYGDMPGMGLGGGNGGPDGNDGGPGPGGGMGDPGGTEARGGVHRTRPGQPRWAIYGEKEPEEAIFIPQHMLQPGIQSPQESQVRRALMRAMMNLQ